MQHRLVDGVLFLLTLLHGNLRSGNLIMGNSLNESLFVEIGNIGYSLESKDLALDMGIARFHLQHRRSPSFEKLFTNANGEWKVLK